MSSGQGPGWDNYPCYNWDEYRTLCNTRSYVRVKNSYCQDCLARGYHSNAENVGSGLVSGRIPFAEHDLASRMQDHYPCRNNCGNYVRVNDTLCTRCVASGHIGVAPNRHEHLNSGSAHEALEEI